MIQVTCPVVLVSHVSSNIYRLSFRSPEIAATIQPGQFVNIKVGEGLQPLLRRPFSAYRVENDVLSILFNITGEGTSLLSRKLPGDLLDILGPLGHSYRSNDDFTTALLVAGGLGVAPFPVLTASLERRNSVEIMTFLGGRNSDYLVAEHLHNVRLATDDGSAGFHGTVVDLLRLTLDQEKITRPKIFACGPTPMLKSLALLAHERQIPSEVSLESVMACGIGICQGCPVELVSGEKMYALICKDGTVFDTRNIVLA